MKISVSAGIYYTKDYREVLDIISNTSCKNIELFLSSRYMDVPLYELEREISKRSLNVFSIHTPLDITAFPRKESERFWIDRSIETAKTFGAKVIVTHMVNGPYFEDGIGSLDELHKRNLTDCRGNGDILVTTENLPYRSAGSFLRRFDELYDFLAGTGVDMTFDTTHCACGGSPLIETFAGFRSFIRNIHISDFKDGIEHKALGEGSLPLKAFVSYLSEEKYDGLLTIETDFDNKKRNDIESMDQAVSTLHNSIDLIENSIKPDR